MKRNRQRKEPASSLEVIKKCSIKAQVKHVPQLKKELRGPKKHPA